MVLLALTLALTPAHAGELSEDLIPLLAGHHAPSCEAVFALGEGEAVRDALLGLSRPDLVPPAVPMRAAACLVSERPEDPVVLAAAAGWVAEPATPGFALIVAQHLDGIPAAPAAELGRALVERLGEEPHLAVHLRPVLQASAHPEVAALVPTAP